MNCQTQWIQSFLIMEVNLADKAGAFSVANAIRPIIFLFLNDWSSEAQKYFEWINFSYLTKVYWSLSAYLVNNEFIKHCVLGNRFHDLLYAIIANNRPIMGKQMAKEIKKKVNSN